MAFIFAIISFLGWGIGDIFTTQASRKIGSYLTTTWNLIIGFLFFSLLIPFQLDNLQNLTVGILILIISLSIVFIAGMLSYYEALKIDNSSIVGTIVASFSALSVLLSLIFLGDRITFYQSLSILIIYLGIFLSIFNYKDVLERKFNLTKGTYFALFAMICWGVYFAFIDIPVTKVGWFWPTYSYYLLFPAVILFFKRRNVHFKRVGFKVGILPVILTTVITGIAEFSYNLAISGELTSLVAPIAGAYPVLFVLLAFWIFKDPITKQQAAGIIITLIGIVLLSGFTN